MIGEDIGIIDVAGNNVQIGDLVVFTSYQRDSSLYIGIVEDFKIAKKQGSLILYCKHGWSAGKFKKNKLLLPRGRTDRIVVITDDVMCNPTGEWRMIRENWLREFSTT